MQRIELQFMLIADKLPHEEELGSKLHGVLMSMISEDYAEKLHHQGTNPYSMVVKRRQNLYHWQINLLTDEAIQQIAPLLLAENFTEFIIESLKQTSAMILKKELSIFTLEDLADIFYQAESSRRLHLKFESPTSFRQNKQFVFYPDIRLIMQSALRKYSAIFEQEEMIDEEILDEMVRVIQITSYQLRSTYTRIHTNRIPAFTGHINIRIDGNRTQQNYILMLLTFAQYAGLGVKCSLGMGSLNVSVNRRK